MTFEEFVVQRSRLWLSIAHGLCGDGAAAEDLVQDAVLKMYRHWDKVAAARSPDGYARRILMNEYLSGRQRRLRLGPGLHARPPEYQPAESDHEDAIVLRDALVGQIRTLPARQQAVLALRYYADLSDTEIAAALGCSPGTVRGYASRALATLRVTVRGDYPRAPRPALQPPVGRPTVERPRP